MIKSDWCKDNNFNQMQCVKRAGSKPIVFPCWLGIRDGKLEVSSSTLRISLWRRWWLVNKRAQCGWRDDVCKQRHWSCREQLAAAGWQFFFFLAPFFSRKVWLELFYWAASRHVPFIYRRLRMCRETGPSPSHCSLGPGGWLQPAPHW